MSGNWLPNHWKTRVSQHGSHISFLDHQQFREIGKLAHELGDLQYHQLPHRQVHEDLDNKVLELISSLEMEDQLLVMSAVHAYIGVANGHAVGSPLCPLSPHFAGAVFSKGYQFSGLAADLTRVCP